ncbi:MAG: patatin-like phospholipase family protein [Pyrinomonadaceae bacterium]
MRNAKNNLAAVVLITQLLSVPILSQAPNSKSSTKPPEDSIVVVPHDELNTIENKDVVFPARGGSVDWGLALSGGGIRSGSFSVGAMKALYDAGYLDNIDAISTVSGGGFASYWLYGLYDVKSQPRFGSAAFGDDSYLRNTCDLQTRSDMYSLGKMVGAVFHKRSNAFDKYMASIHRTFGVENTGLEDLRIASYNDAVRRARVPYLIINTSLNVKGLRVQSVEVTPDYVGNDKLGYGRWTSSPLFREAVAWSAAGIKFKLKQEVPNFAPGKAPDKNFYLYDGGWSENSGALPLIRRGIQNVIVIDSEHDPRYQYGAYFKLKNTLKDQYNIDLSVCDVGQQLSQIPTKFIMKGTARRVGKDPIETTIYWVKMTRPEFLFPKDRDEQLRNADGWKKAEALLREWYKAGVSAAAIRDVATKPTDYHKHFDAICDAAPKRPIDPAMYYWLANRYRYRLAATKWKKLGIFGKGGVYEFPQLTTWDQSYYPDQMEAFIGLGYLEGKVLVELLNTDGADHTEP